jgi:cytochrome c oxidase subunit 3
MPEPQPTFQFADLRQQHDAAQLGMWVFLATELLFFGGLILAYTAYRVGDPRGFADAARHTEIVIGAVNTAVLLTSSFLVAWAVMAARLRLANAAAILLWAAAALGILLLILKGVEYRMEYDER